MKEFTVIILIGLVAGLGFVLAFEALREWSPPSRLAIALIASALVTHVAMRAVVDYILWRDR